MKETYLRVTGRFGLWRLLNRQGGVDLALSGGTGFARFLLFNKRVGENGRVSLVKPLLRLTLSAKHTLGTDTWKTKAQSMHQNGTIV